MTRFLFLQLVRSVDRSAASFVCSLCWLKVKSFHEFYLMVEAIHNRCASEIGEEPQSDVYIEKEQLSEAIEVDSVQPTENVKLNIDILDYGTNSEHDVYLDERTEEPHNGETSSYQDTKHEIELHLNDETDLELDKETELKLNTEDIPATEHRRLQTIKIHEITPLQGANIPNQSVPRPKRGRPKKPVRQSDDIV